MRDQLDVDRIIQLMTGRDLAELRHPHDRVPGDAVIAFEHPAAEPALGNPPVRAREVMGLAGLLGSGTTELLRRLFGAEGRAAFVLNGKRIEVATPEGAIARRIGLVPGERAQALVPGLTVRENIVLPNLDRLAGTWRLDVRKVDALVKRLMDELDIRPRDPGRLLRELSGGNQQKVVFARWIAGEAAVLLLDEPTHGIDIHFGLGQRRHHPEGLIVGRRGHLGQPHAARFDQHKVGEGAAHVHADHTPRCHSAAPSTVRIQMISPGTHKVNVRGLAEPHQACG
jgi:ABC-type sugar transport system ATPase subunit